VVAGHAGMGGVSEWSSRGREKERVSGKKISKIFFPPISTFAREKKLHRAVQNGTVQVFFYEEKKKKIGSYPKIGYDNKHVMLCSLHDNFVYLEIAFFVYFFKIIFFSFLAFSIWLVRIELPILFRFIFHGVITTSCPRSQVSQVNHDWSGSS
jgi:hypothetical protein